MSNCPPLSPVASTNADLAELLKFNTLAARWWDETSQFKPLHRINPHRLQWIENLAGLANQSVLDIGCGGGILAESMARRGAHVTGIDLADKPLQIAKLHAAEQQVAVDYALSSAEDWVQAHANSYNVVTCMEMLEHVPDPESVVAACAKLVCPGGWVFFSTISRTHLSYWVAIVGAERVLQLLPRGTHDWAKFIKPHELLTMAQRHGLTLQDQRGLGYNPFTQQFRLHSFMGVGYLLALQMPKLAVMNGVRF
jgi:2-polyprenyl-6-hydroxyphenyl methylase / 3-demethylubiquinone-9 3-methyltransferase